MLSRKGQIQKQKLEKTKLVGQKKDWWFSGVRGRGRDDK